MRCFIRRVLASVLTFGLVGCLGAGRDYVPPQARVSADFSQQQQAQGSTAAVPEYWWRGFQDAELDRLVDLAKEANLDVHIALAQLRAARAQRRGSWLDLFPKVTADAGATRRRVSPAEFFAPSGEVLEQNLFEAGFDARWEIDLFGRLRSGLEAASAEVEAAEAVHRDALVSVIAELTRNYFELRGTQQRRVVAGRRADNQQEMLTLTEKRVQAGRGTVQDVATARAELNDTLASLPPLEAQIQRAIHRLSVLTAQTPDALDARLSAPAALPGFRHEVALGDPAALLRRRPDIRIAERRLAADTARIGVASADLFPRVSLLGSLGLASRTFSGFTEGESRVYSIGPSLSWAALDLGSVRARIRTAGERAQASLAAYEQTVLRALEETENALVDFGRTRERREFLKKAAEASGEAARVARARFEGGVANLSSVLETERGRLESEERLAVSETSAVTALVAVYKALGGGAEAVAPQDEPRPALAANPEPASPAVEADSEAEPDVSPSSAHSSLLRDRGFIYQ